jgi:hypothetical protein
MHSSYLSHTCYTSCPFHSLSPFYFRKECKNSPIRKLNRIIQFKIGFLSISHILETQVSKKTVITVYEVTSEKRFSLLYACAVATADGKQEDHYKQQAIHSPLHHRTTSNPLLSKKLQVGITEKHIYIYPPNHTQQSPQDTNVISTTPHTTSSSI